MINKYFESWKLGMLHAKTFLEDEQPENINKRSEFDEEKIELLGLLIEAAEDIMNAYQIIRDNDIGYEMNAKLKDILIQLFSEIDDLFLELIFKEK